jgi:hypothetical protein
MPPIRNFILSLFVFTLGVGLLDFIWIRYSPLNYHFPHPWIILAFFFTVTALFHLGLLRSSQKSPASIVRFYMTTSAIKLFAYLLIMVAYLYIDKAHGKIFALGFLGHYFLFSAFELTALLRHFKR